METIYLVYGKRYKEEELVYVGSNKDAAMNFYYACHQLDLDTDHDISLSLNHHDGWIQVWIDGKLAENEWRPSLEGIE